MSKQLYTYELSYEPNTESVKKKIEEDKEEDTLTLKTIKFNSKMQATLKRAATLSGIKLGKVAFNERRKSLEGGKRSFAVRQA